MSLVMTLDGIWITCNLLVICSKVRNICQLWQQIIYFTQPTTKYCKQQQNGPLTNSDAAFQSHDSKFVVQNTAVF